MGSIYRKERWKKQKKQYWIISKKGVVIVDANKVLDVARKELGVKESPANSNRVKYNTWYYGREVSGAAYTW